MHCCVVGHNGSLRHLSVAIWLTLEAYRRSSACVSSMYLSIEVFGKNMKPRHGVVVKRHPKWNHDKFAFPALWNMAIDVTCACLRGVSHVPMGRSRSRYKHVSGVGPAASVNSQTLYTRPLCIVQMSLLSLATSPAVYVYVEAEMYARTRRVFIH